MRLVIPDIPKSPNRRRGEHWSRSSKYAKYWKDLVRSQILCPGDAKGKYRVDISQMRKRKLDPDNLMASVKPCVDALVHWGLIFDDDSDHLDLYVYQLTGPELMTIIEIKKLGLRGAGER